VEITLRRVQLDESAEVSGELRECEHNEGAEQTSYFAVQI